MSLLGITLVQGVQLPASVGIQYTAPSNSKVIIRHATFCNTTAGAITVTAYIVPNGGSVGDPTTVISAQSLAGHAAYVSPELSGVVLNAGDTLQCFASAATSISLNASGILQQ
jgi:hypothetical protein